ncbi:S9 family peptidase [Indiicoccus explosivorum]|uniref:alpha/beta hydrolase family protein n=1 Tax=Indiicoccus explosivorum TaxID=1917864 RepID=UPI0030C6AA86
MGDVRLYYASLDGAIYPATGEGEHVYGYSISADGDVALLAVSTPVNPGELYLLDIVSGEQEALTSFNKDYTDGTDLAEPEPISAVSGEYDVHGWLMKPRGFEEGKKFPLIVNIHGGPHAMYGNTFFHEMQLLSARGFGVLYVNPRGSHSYSQIFVDAVRGDYGGGDYRDIMNALDSVIESNSWIDTERLGVTGGSYGGFMTNWIVGHTDRFKAAVTQRSISNWISFFGTSDIGYYFSDWQHGADMSEPDRLWDISPLKYAENISTPLLILHAENDSRCPIEQAEQLYITLKSMGKETEFIRFPESDHNLSRTGKPNLRYARLEALAGWMEERLK